MTDFYYAGIDLGTTNIKAALYQGETLSRIAWCSRSVEYSRQGNRVEFDGDALINTMLEMLQELGSNALAGSIRAITLTGQAESLILLDNKYRPLRPAISWMDERSIEECEELSRQFTADEIYNVTGQKAVIPTWPATKIISLSRTEPECLAKTSFFVLLKDYAAYKLTGILAADRSIATFSFYFDIHNGCYWEKMLDTCKIDKNRLPPLTEPCTILGPVNPALDLGAAYSQAQVNTGTLDHFAGMIGSGNIIPGVLSESCGTVMAMAAMVRLPLTGKETAALHYGPFPGTMVMLPVAESGGICLEWFRDNFLPGMTFDEINAGISKKTGAANRLIFLPYISGVNAPEFDKNASGLFYGLRTETTALDMARAVMEGVALLLDKNLAEMRSAGLDFSHIICTGGAAKSDLWSQIKADICNCEIRIPADSETASRGAAIIGAVTTGAFSDYAEAIKNCVRTEKRFYPIDSKAYNFKKTVFRDLYRAMIKFQAPQA